MSDCIHPSIYCHDITFFYELCSSTIIFFRIFLVKPPHHIICAKQVQCKKFFRLTICLLSTFIKMHDLFCYIQMYVYVCGLGVYMYMCDRICTRIMYQNRNITQNLIDICIREIKCNRKIISILLPKKVSRIGVCLPCHFFSLNYETAS